jgi:hypothetical protein
MKVCMMNFGTDWKGLYLEEISSGCFEVCMKNEKERRREDGISFRHVLIFF